MPTNLPPNQVRPLDFSQHIIERRESTISHQESGYIKAYSQPVAGWGSI